MKLFRLMLAVLLVLALCACSSNTTPATDPQQTNPTPTKPTQTEPVQTEPVVTTEPTTAPTEPENPTVPLEPVTESGYADYRYELEEVCTFGNIDRLAFSSHMPVIRKTENGAAMDYLYSYTGELKIAEGCRKYEYYGEGRTAMYTDGNTRFVNVSTGEVYLEGADITRVLQMNDRYYFVVFADHGKVYDLQRACYLDGLKVTDLSLSAVPRAINDTVFEKVAFGQYRVYLSDGSVYGEIKEVSFTETGYICQVKDGLEVYDSNCNLLRFVENATTCSEYASEQANTYSWKYYRTGEFRNWSVIDINGDPVLPGTYDTVQVYGDYIVVTDANSKQGLYLADGTQLLEIRNKDIYGVADPLAFRFTNADGVKQIYLPGCGVRDLGEFLASGSYINYSRKQFMIPATGEIMEFDKAYTMNYGGLLDTNQGLIGGYTGETLFEAGYEFAAATEEYLYVRQNGTWHVYKYSLVKK